MPPMALSEAQVVISYFLIKIERFLDGIGDSLHAHQSCFYTATYSYLERSVNWEEFRH